MKFTLSLLALPFLGALAAPTETSNKLAVRQDNSTSAESQAFSIVEDLYAEVQQYTAAINSTAAGLNADSTSADNETAAADFRSNVQKITDAVSAASSSVNELSPSSGGLGGILGKRQSAADQQLANLVSNLLLDISGALGNILNTLGLGSLLGALGPLTTALSGLLISLRNVVDQLLALVKQLVDGLLTGLSIGLLGL